jgi:hypothetical protein
MRTPSYCLLVLTLLLTACASPEPTGPAVDRLLVDKAFSAPAKPVDLRQAMAMNDEMARFAIGPLAAEVRQHGAREGLISAMSHRSGLKLDYDTGITRTAGEAFQARTGNCLSLVLMTASFARHLNLPVRFNSVYVDETWTRNNGLFFVTGHVNITLGRPVGPSGNRTFHDAEMVTVDFMPPEQTRGQRSTAIDEQTLLAMYANNRAAESMAVDQLNEAYWWIRAAIQADPRWLSSYNTLAVLYRRKGLGAPAEAALRYVLDREHENVQALSNLALVLNDAGRKAEADQLTHRLSLIQPVPPYKYFDEGVAAMRIGDYRTAKAKFERELARAAYVAEFHFWLGLANWGLGNPTATREHINQALENSATQKDRRLYAAKLAWLEKNTDLGQDSERDNQRRLDAYFRQR